MRQLNVIHLGVIPYNTALEIQDYLHQRRVADIISDTLIFLEHPPTFTTGRRGDERNILVNERFLKENNITFEKVGRGGDVTYHGPGQIVGYPILDLGNYNKDVHWYLRKLEDVIILALADYGIEARRLEKLTGVWVKRSKIASIGVGIRKWTTYHGFALNVNNDLSFFDMIVPCGIPSVCITSLRQWLGSHTDIDTNAVKKSLIRGFKEVFKIEDIEEFYIKGDQKSQLESSLQSIT